MRSTALKSDSTVKLLLVDDDDVDREKFRRLLRKSGLHTEVEEASSGRDALDLLQRGRYDCVVVDYRLGDTTGTDLARTIRSSESGLVPIIMVTGLGDERVAVEAMREGVYDYLAKSQLNPEGILSAIKGSLHWAKLEAELQSAEERLRRLSLFDSLTELPNRNLFFDRLDQTLQAAERGELRMALTMMDLNLFKEVNDTLGHAAGDRLLAEIGRRLGKLARSGDTYARIGGDEFAGLLSGCDSVTSAGVVAEKIQSVLSEPMILENEVIRVSASIGVALYPEHGRDSRTLLAHADQAMYRAKRNSRSYEVYRSGPHESRSFLISSYLADALERGEIYLEYQPKVSLSTGNVVGVEALARWRNQRLGMVSPNDFIPSAERSPLIRPLTYGILEMALEQARRWCDQGIRLPIAVNLSARMFDDSELTSRVCQALIARDLDPQDLTLEITETALMSSPARAQETLRSLRLAGILISIDDFGAGYTSLKYLRDFDISEIKIDRMFITRLDAGTRDASIVRSIAALSAGFNLKLVAEGIEDEAQSELLHELGCEYGQGYGIGYPMSPDALDAWRVKRSTMPAPLRSRRPTAQV